MSHQVRWSLFAVGAVASLIVAVTLVRTLPRRPPVAKDEATVAAIPKPIATPPLETPSSIFSWGMRGTPAPPEREAPEPANELLARTEKDLLGQMLTIPTVALDHSESRSESRDAGRKSERETLALIDRRADLAGLPIRRGEECRQTSSASRILGAEAGNLRRWALNPLILVQNLAGRKGVDNAWVEPDAVPALMQVLMAENAEVREILAGHLARIKGRPATAALVRLALFDLAPQVRSVATAGLSKRPPKDYRPLLLRGFDHPWPVVAENAARAFVALRDRRAVPALTTLLHGPDPRAPFRKPNRKALRVKEVVRVHHMTNCLLCHPASSNSGDEARGRVPDIDAPAVGPAAYYTPGGREGVFVRGDVTYLEQDFSAMLPVDRPGLGSSEQRFDFLVRDRAATASDIAASRAREKAGPTAHRKALLFALGELSARRPIVRR